METLEIIFIIATIFINVYLYYSQKRKIKKIKKLLNLEKNLPAQAKKIYENIHQEIYTLNNLVFILDFSKEFCIYSKIFVASQKNTIKIFGKINVDYIEMCVGRKNEWCKYLSKSHKKRNTYGICDDKLIEFYDKYELTYLHLSFLDKDTIYIIGDIDKIIKNSNYKINSDDVQKHQTSVDLNLPNYENKKYLNEQSYGFFAELFKNIERLEKSKPSKKLVQKNKEILSKVNKDKQNAEVESRIKAYEDKKILERQILGINESDAINPPKIANKFVFKRK
ncbi:hypothetical protein DMUE_5016 [Dictyocoela muelleri]|nr:hypothetical protein DMUE_5016 [Dictyocoela muelleri]